MQNPADARRRWFGLLFLILAGGLLIWGETWLRPYLRGWVFVVYWLACFVFTFLAMGVAWLDWRAIRRAAREQKRAMARKVFEAGEDHQPRDS